MCSFEDCENPARSKGLCHAHYQQDRAGKALTALRPRAPRNSLPPKPQSIAPQVRAWARENGVDVPAKGIIPQHVMDAWRNR